MIIRSIRLRNIKCYGEGPAGQGTTVPFEPGINRIAGRNGHGKSTLIEALGYALFLAGPQFEERLQTERYFLSHGAKEGEIDITFTHGGETYRVERGLGKASKRMSKVVQLSDNSICAEKDDQVEKFLCDLLKFPHPDRLRELFSKLIGVKQGRLTWPFDSKPAEAKKFFEPLLDVAVFRDCFEQLKPAADLFKDQAADQDRMRIAIQARIDERADSAEKLKQAQEILSKTEASLQQAEAALAEALKQKNHFEQLQAAAEVAKTRAAQSHLELEHARSFRAAAEQAVQEARDAAGKAQQHHFAFTAYREAEAALTQLEEKRTRRDAIKTSRDQSEAARVRAEAHATAAREQATVFTGQKTAKETERLEIQARHDVLAAQLEKTKAAFESEKAAADRATREIGAIADLVPRLEELATVQSGRIQHINHLTSEIAAWDAATLAAAESAEQAARVTLEKARDDLARARERLKTLKEQLKQISGGVCPFLKVQCEQFDPDKVSADVSACEVATGELQISEKQANAAHDLAKKQLAALVAAGQAIVHKQKELQTCTADYVRPFRTLVPEKPLSAAVWLSTWANEVPPMPPAPGVCDPALEPVRAADATFRAWLDSMQSWWTTVQAICNHRLNEFAQTGKCRLEKEESLRHCVSRTNDLAKEIDGLQKRIASAAEDAATFEKARNTALAEVARQDEALKTYATLDTDLRTEQAKRDANRAGHAEYLQAKGLADQLPARETSLAGRKTTELAAATTLALARAAEEKAASAFDSDKLNAARQQHQTRHDAVSGLKFTRDQLKLDLQKAQERFREWQEFSTQCAGVERAIRRLQAALELTEVARRTLKDAASEVARHICQRIARRAQRLFNQINPEPAEIAWDSGQYSLQIDPGDRRFAMLSGGEQTKLALALTLAMIEEFCGLRFCVFDEPTYGVDADSRKKLMDAILEAQQAASLEQLLLVSHDDAFEDRIEHSIILTKTSALGSVPVIV